MKLCMIGTGYVGLVSGTCFADLGNQVYCVDKDKDKINKLNKGISPIYEPGLNELIKKNFSAKRLFFSTDLKESIQKSDIIFICVGTPNKKGTLNVGAPADIAVLDLQEGNFQFIDNYENVRNGTYRFFPFETILGGQRAPRV